MSPSHSKEHHQRCLATWTVTCAAEARCTALCLLTQALSAGTGRFPPQPRFEPFSFYSCVRLGDAEQLKLVRFLKLAGGVKWLFNSCTRYHTAAQIMDTDPYFWSQNNGGGAPVHFATTYKQLDMVRDSRTDTSSKQIVQQRHARSRCSACINAAPCTSSSRTAAPYYPQLPRGCQPAR